jgi:[ribosomal protein S5]-alanine N-acetyltransferase
MSRMAITLTTDRLLLRAFRPEDAEDLYEYLSDEQVVRFEPYGLFTRAMCAREALARSLDDAFIAVCLKDTGKLIGNLYFETLSGGTCELGFVFSRAFQNRGYAAESAGELMRFAFTALGVLRIIARCNPQNERSWRLMERLGMRREKHLRQNVAFKTDDMGFPLWQDTFEYAILASECYPAASSRPSAALTEPGPSVISLK